MRPDRILRCCVLVLCLGGWVCQSNVADRCPGGNTCDIEVANVCCPYGSNVYCDGTCTNSPSGCMDTVHVCADESRVLDCSFDATIESVNCEGPSSDGWHIVVRGTLKGCGQETVFFKDESATQPDVDCGSWSDGVFGGCVPPSASTSSTTWTYQRTSTADSRTLTLVRAHGAAPPLASMHIDCTP